MKIRRMLMVPAVFAAFLGAAALGTPNTAAAAPLAANDTVHAVADVSSDGSQSAVWAGRSVIDEAPVVNDRRGGIRGRGFRRSGIIGGGGVIVSGGGFIGDGFAPFGGFNRFGCGFDSGFGCSSVVVRRFIVSNGGCGCDFGSNVIVTRRFVNDCGFGSNFVGARSGFVGGC